MSNSKQKILAVFALALLLAAALDLGSTLLAVQRMGGWHGEANPVFRALGSSGNSTKAILIVLCIKGIPSVLLLLWLILAVDRIPSIYPPPDRSYEFIEPPPSPGRW